MKFAALILVLLFAAPANAELRLLRFTQESCPPCRAMAPIWASIDVKLPVQEIDTNKFPGLTRGLGVSTTPTAMIVDVESGLGGKITEKRRLVGLHSRAEVIKFLEP